MQIDVRDLESKLSEVVEMASQGHTIVIVDGQHPVARLGPVENPHKQVRLGLMKGKIRIHGSFDAPLPPHVLDEFENVTRG
jgi:antitoxin (DNA-binding transcriptional repressor) of toxin-antitoxin stability system